MLTFYPSRMFRNFLTDISALIFRVFFQKNQILRENYEFQAQLSMLSMLTFYVSPEFVLGKNSENSHLCNFSYEKVR